MRLVLDLNYVYERCHGVLLTPSQSVEVKGQNYILAALKMQLPLVESLGNRFASIKSIKDSMDEWIAYLDKKYSEQQIFLGPPTRLDQRDAENLQRDCNNWMNSVMTVFAEDGTVLLKQEAINTILPDTLKKGLDDITREDLNDGISAIFHLLPTPGAMILFRVAENIVRKYYSKITGKQSGNLSWGKMLQELEQIQQPNSSLLGYLRYLKDKRNEAEHPDKRFSQEETERILLQIKGLLEEVLNTVK